MCRGPCYGAEGPNELLERTSTSRTSRLEHLQFCPGLLLLPSETTGGSLIVYAVFLTPMSERRPHKELLRGEGLLDTLFAGLPLKETVPPRGICLRVNPLTIAVTKTRSLGPHQPPTGTPLANGRE